MAATEVLPAPCNRLRARPGNCRSSAAVRPAAPAGRGSGARCRRYAPSPRRPPSCIRVRAVHPRRSARGSARWKSPAHGPGARMTAAAGPVRCSNADGLGLGAGLAGQLAYGEVSGHGLDLAGTTGLITAASPLFKPRPGLAGDTHGSLLWPQAPGTGSAGTPQCATARAGGGTDHQPGDVPDRIRRRHRGALQRAAGRRCRHAGRRHRVRPEPVGGEPGGALGSRCSPGQGGADPGLLCVHRAGGHRQAGKRRAPFQRRDARLRRHRAVGQSGVPGVAMAVPHAQHQHEKHLCVLAQRRRRQYRRTGGCRWRRAHRSWLAGYRGGCGHGAAVAEVRGGRHPRSMARMARGCESVR
ncbi:hypothetical protein G6F57_012868 [Rhizopus arrhizus]|nr:hypothetical protein G6F57_012868 [Rhizopus arrhizus]